MGLAKKIEIVLDIDLKKNVLSEQQIVSISEKVFELYEVRNEFETIGPFEKETLKQYFEIYPDQVAQYQIRQLKESNWANISNHPYFQRRKPQIIERDQSINNMTEIYLLKDGTKKGPIDVTSLHKKLRTNEILVTDFISIDHGKNWKKIFTYEEFDRRTFKASESLPITPNAELFDKSHIEVVTNFENNESFQEKTDVLVGLAFATSRGHERNIPTSKHDKKHIVPTDETPIVIQKKSRLPYLILGIVITSIVIIAITQLFSTGAKEKVTSQDEASITNQETTGENPTISKRKRQETKAKIQEIKERNNARKIASPNRSIKETEILSSPDIVDENYQERDDEYFFDENETPVELDPVREELSKDTIDPENEVSENPFKAVRDDSTVDFNESELPQDSGGPDSETGLFEEEVQY